MSNEPDEVNNGALATMIVLLFVATFAIAMAVTALVRDEVKAVKAQGDLTQERGFRVLRAEQRAALAGTPSWSDAEQKLVKVSVERSMEIVSADLRRNPYALTPTRPQKEDEEAEELEEGEEGEDNAAGDGADAGQASEAAPGKASQSPPVTPAKKPSTPAPAVKSPAAPAKTPAATPTTKAPAAKAPPAPVTKPTAPANKP